MRGELVKKEDKWYIKSIEEGDWETYYELHPDDVEQIKQDALVFDDIEVRIKAWPDTPFTIYEKWEEVDGETKVTRYGKVKSVIEENNEKIQALQFLTTQAQELDMGYSQSIKRTGKMTEEEWQAAENNLKPKYTPGKGISFYIPTEISDEEIEKSAKEWYEKEGWVHYKAEIRAWVSACKWYREQLRIRNEKK
jgi:hypothetical protein